MISIYAQSQLSLDILFPKVGDVDSFWDWARETLVLTMYPGPLYNDKIDKNKGVMEDRHNYLVGISRLRQERIKAGTKSNKIFPTTYSLIRRGWFFFIILLFFKEVCIISLYLGCWP